MPINLRFASSLPALLAGGGVGGHGRAAMTEPLMSHDVIAFYLLSERVSKEVKVVLAGQGADEVFGGYFWYPLMDAETGPPVARFGRHYFDCDQDCLARRGPAETAG